MVVPAHEELLALVVNQQDTVVFLFVLIRKMSPKNYADRGIGTVLALEDILVHAGCHVRNIAHLGIVHGKRDEGVVAGST